MSNYEEQIKKLEAKKKELKKKQAEQIKKEQAAVHKIVYEAMSEHLKKVGLDDKTILNIGVEGVKQKLFPVRPATPPTAPQYPTASQN